MFPLLLTSTMLFSLCQITSLFFSCVEYLTLLGSLYGSPRLCRVLRIKTLTNLGKSTSNCDIVTKTPALKDNFDSKLNSDIFNYVPKCSISSSLTDIPESNKSNHEVSPVTDQRFAFR